MGAASLDTILNHPAIWRGNECARVAIPSTPSGFHELDAVLPGGGWPAATLTEICVERPGSGELQLLMPAAARLTCAGRWIMLIAPPHIPYAPAFAAHGVRLSRLILVRAPGMEERFWACEQALRSQGCGAILAWIEHAPQLALQRLQLAIAGRNTAAVLFRSSGAIAASPAALRLHVSRAQSRTVVRVLKRRGSDLSAPIVLDLQGSTFRSARRSDDARPLETVA
jgi:cell division inhibitor SulA/protein ImuA